MHGQRSCQSCHGGPADRTFETMEEAHTGMVADPSAHGACDGCHADEAAAHANSLHANQWGYIAAIELRGRCTFEGSGFEGFFDQKCGGCHTTCGQCHVSRPASVGGGFPLIGTYYSHRFRASPDMTEQCVACHGSRVGNDFLGQSEGNVPDVHRQPYGWQCKDCHTKEEIHGDAQHDGEHYEHRYEVKTMPRCEDCHGEGQDDGWDNAYHAMHVGNDGLNLQCQVCHSQPYKNCTNCHNLVADGEGEKYDIDPSRLQFKIGRNPSPHRTEYDYSVVRHLPIDPGTYADWGLDLPGYLDAPTWVYASPHNIVRRTAQTTVGEGQSCSTACHQSPDGAEGFLLRESDLYQDDGVTRLPDYEANLGVVIPSSFPDAK